MQPAESPQEEVERLPLRTLGLKPGMALQTRRLADGARKQESQFFGAIEGKGVMVGTLGSEGEPCDLRAGDVCLVRGFTGQYEYAFPSKVLQTFEQPFAYALLAYPALVDAKRVRQSMRVKGNWPCSVAVPHTDGSPLLHAVTLVDLSVHGAMVRSPQSMASVGREVHLHLAVEVNEAPVQWTVQATVCHHHPAKLESAYLMGLAFKGVSQQDKLLLTYLTQNS